MSGQLPGVRSKEARPVFLLTLSSEKTYPNSLIGREDEFFHYTEERVMKNLSTGISRTGGTNSHR